MDTSEFQKVMEAQKKNCIFCKIISGEIPSNEVYSDDKVKVILDINPANEGHCLILPKEHFQILPQMPKELISHIFVIAKRTSKALLTSLGVKGTTLFVANGAVAGQKAPHFMVHVIPRQRGDMLFRLPKSAPDKEFLVKMQKDLASKLSYDLPKIAEDEGSLKEPESRSDEKMKAGDLQEQAVEDSGKQEKKGGEIDLDKISGLFS